MAGNFNQRRKEAEKLLSKIQKIESLIGNAETSANRTEDLANSIQMNYIQLWEYAKDTKFKNKFLKIKKSKFRNGFTLTVHKGTVPVCFFVDGACFY